MTKTQKEFFAAAERLQKVIDSPIPQSVTDVLWKMWGLSPVPALRERWAEYADALLQFRGALENGWYEAKGE